MKYVRKVDDGWKVFEGDRLPASGGATYVYLNWEDLAAYFGTMVPDKKITQFAMERGGIEVRLEDKE